MKTDENRELDWQLRRLRLASSGRRSSQAAREETMRQFALRHGGPKRALWAWPLAIAAALALTVSVVHLPTRPAPVPVLAEEVSDSNDGFIPVPFVPPLAQGELVHVIHTELHPATLAGLGVNVDPAWVTSLPADLLVGEDGFPRAVRISNEDRGGL